MWLSEDKTERDLAATYCGGCAVWLECGTAATANRERFGVWGGRDFSRPPGKKAA
jgi:hypothetical protein